MVGSVAGQRRPRAPRSPPTGGCARGGGEGPPGTQRVASRLRSTGSACPLRVRRADVALLHPEAGLLYPPPSLLLAPGNPWTVLTWTSLSVLAGRPLGAQAPVSPTGRPCRQGRKRGELGLWPVAAWLGGDAVGGPVLGVWPQARRSPVL